MLIRNFSLNDYDMGDHSNQKECGLFDARRTMYVFVTNTEYNLKSFKIAKTAIINECVYDSKVDFTHPVKLDNSYIVRKAVYFGNIICAVPGDIQSHGSIFSLDNVISSEKSVSPGVDVLSHGSNVYSTRLITDVNPMDRQLLDIEYEVRSIPPQYYNEYMMYKDIGDWPDLFSDPDGCKTNVSELIDHSTTIQFMDVDKYDTMRLQLTGGIINAESQFNNSISIPTSLGTAFSSYEGRGATFIYDSDAFGIGKYGVNVKGGYVPQGKFYDKPWIADNLAKTLEYFSMNCKDVENQFGHLRVMYNPDALGNKYKIKFKDYRVSPITPLSKIANNGAATLDKPDTTISGIDTGYTVDRSILDNIQSVQKANDVGFMKEMQGW